jgi:hypothetical protein
MKSVLCSQLMTHMVFMGVVEGTSWVRANGPMESGRPLDGGSIAFTIDGWHELGTTEPHLAGTSSRGKDRAIAMESGQNRSK